MLSNTALRILRRVLGSATREAGPYAGDATVLDGNTAVAVTEASISETAALGASFPADLADLAWRSEQRRMGTNLAGRPLSGFATEGPRGILSAAMGLTMAGTRASGFLSGVDLAAGRDLLSKAAACRLPLVVHLSNRAIGGQSATLGSGHEALHLAADSGCLLLTASNVQEAVDYTLVARRVAEQALTTAMVGMDGVCTALAMQDVRLIPSAMIKTFLGEPGDLIATPNDAQRMLFGDTRRRLPRWHNPDRPVLLGALQPPQAWATGHAAGRAFFDPHTPHVIDQAFAQFGELTGRQHRRISAHRVQGARLILVAQGAGVEAAEAVADHLRSQHRIKAGVIGIRCLSPFPGAEMSQLLGKAARVCVLERTATPLAEDPPLLRELRAALNRASENAHAGAALHPGYHEVQGKHRPRLHSVLYGLGGQPLHSADLVALCREIDTLDRPQVYLGLGFSPADSVYPKRQVLLDRLRRSYPDSAKLGIKAPGPDPDLRPKSAVSLAIHRLSGGAGRSLAATLASVLQRIISGGLRCRPGLSSEPWGAYCVDRVAAAGEGLRDPGERAPVDLVVVTDDGVLPMLDDESGLAPDSRLLVHSELADDVLWARLPVGVRHALGNGSARLQRVSVPTDMADSGNEYLMGAVFGVLLESGRLDISSRRLIASRSAALRQDVAEAPLHLAAFEAGLRAPREIDTAVLALQRPRVAAVDDDEAPALVSNFGGSQDTYDSLSRFWDQVGVLYKNNEIDELAPDPYLAVAAIPPRSAGFHDLSPLRQQLPELDPALCTGCGDCWSACPDSAINAVAASPARLIEAGIRWSKQDALRPLASKIAAKVTALCRDPATRTPTVAELLHEAYTSLKDKLPYPAQRKQAVKGGLDRLIDDLGCLPLVVTAPFFDEPENASIGRGELLFLSVDPISCKGCGMCVQACSPGALRFVHQTPPVLDRVRRVRAAWDRMPDTEAATIERLEHHPDVGLLNALQLSRDAALSIAGGDGSEPGSGAKLALRLTLATFEARQIPRFRTFAKQVEETRGKITELIREILAGALPADDMEALSRALASVDTRQVELSAFLGDAEQVIEDAMDAVRLRRLVDLAKALADLAWRLARGRQGLGRARMGLVLSATGPDGWSVTFPHNPLVGPAAMDTSGDGALLAGGLLEGQLRQATDDFILMRKASVELNNPDDASRQWSDLERLSWHQLDDEERALCPGLLLVGDSGTLAGRGLGQLMQLLASDLPVRVLLLADLGLGLASHSGLDTAQAAIHDPGIDLGMLMLAQPGVYLAQTSLANAHHLGESLDMALAAQGPALLHVHAPSPTRHGYPADLTLQRAAAAVQARVFPLFRYNPDGAGVFGSRISLDDNPSPLESWWSAADNDLLTPAHWALDEGRFAELFEPLADEAPDPLPLMDYLALSEQAQRTRTPYLEQTVSGEQVRRVQVDVPLIRVCMQRLQAWRRLQELAGLVTPFTERVRQEAAQQVAEAHQVELAEQAREYERRVEGLRCEIQQQNRRDIRERLMRLAGYRQPQQPPSEHER